MAEARRLWDIESFKKPCITTLQAALTMSYITTMNGMDEIAFIYMSRACEMGHELKLFEMADSSLVLDVNMAKARTYTAWATFIWQATLNYAYRRASALEPPHSSLPDPMVRSQWYGEVWVQYPHIQTITPVYLGHKMYAEAALLTMQSELGRRLFKDTASPLSVDELIAFKNKVNDWMKNLSGPLQPKKLIFPQHMSLQ